MPECHAIIHQIITEMSHFQMLDWRKCAFFCLHIVSLKGALSGPRQYLPNENPLKIMKNAFYFTLKALFVLKVFKFLS